MQAIRDDFDEEGAFLKSRAGVSNCIRELAMQQNFKNPCITLHQPWASLLVYGIKRVEGRSWPAPVRALSGRLWIHAAAKVPDPATIAAMENFYREVYNVDGITEIKFPEHYPVSVLIGSVKVVGCVKQEELVSWEILPNGVRLEGQTDFCWLCEEPQRLVVPFEMRGWQGVYNLERKIAADASRALRPISGPSPVKFPLPNPADPSSLRPGVIESLLQGTGKVTHLVNTPILKASIADAREAANQFRKKEHSEGPPHSQTKVLASYSISSLQNGSSPFEGRKTEHFKRQHPTSTFSLESTGEATAARCSSSSVE